MRQEMVEEYQEVCKDTLSQAIKDEVIPRTDAGRNYDMDTLEALIDQKLQKGLDKVFENLNHTIQQKIEQKLVIQQNQQQLQQNAQKLQIPYRSNEYRVDGSMILQNSNAEVNFKGMSGEKIDNSVKDMQNSKFQTSNMSSHVFSFTPEEDVEESWECEEKPVSIKIEQTENIGPNSKKQTMKQSKSSAVIAPDKSSKVGKIHSNQKSARKAVTEEPSVTAEEMQSVMSMYLNNQVSKEDILENIMEVEREMTDPNNLQEIAFRLQQKLEEKAHKLRELEQQQQYEMNAEYYSGESEEEESYTKEQRSIDDKYLTMSESNMQEEYFDHNLSDVYTSQQSFHPRYD